MRIVLRSLSNDGMVCKVPLDDSDNPQYAIVDEETWRELMEPGCNPRWGRDRKTGRVTVWCANYKKRVYVDRLVADCGKNETVYPQDGDHLNLRDKNFIRGYSAAAQKRARDILVNSIIRARPLINVQLEQTI
jgi:hypothetical protein